jgi:FlaA1/EpsC-like NDP-sugar epimerase
MKNGHGAILMPPDASRLFEGKHILVTGGTGSLGKVLVRRLLSGRHGVPARVLVFSRDEGKHHDMRLLFSRIAAASEDVVYHDRDKLLKFRIGDVRDFFSVQQALSGIDIVFNAAALKQVPNCEYFPAEAIATNTAGPLNIARAISLGKLPVEAVVGISTDKACHPVNVMGMTKALQERCFISANLDCPDSRMMCARYGNVLASRGSVVPLFHSQIMAGGPVTITTREMTRYFLSLEQAVDTVVETFRLGRRGEIFVPRVPASKIDMLAQCLIGDRNIPIREIGIRPGEKIHEILVAEDEAERTVTRGDYYAIRPALPELEDGESFVPALSGEYSSHSHLMDRPALMEMLARNRLFLEDQPDFSVMFGSKADFGQVAAGAAS